MHSALNWTATLYNTLHFRLLSHYIALSLNCRHYTLTILYPVLYFTLRLHSGSLSCHFHCHCQGYSPVYTVTVRSLSLPFSLSGHSPVHTVTVRSLSLSLSLSGSLQTVQTSQHPRFMPRLPPETSGPVFFF